MNLPGVEIEQLEALTKTDQADYTEFWDMVYNRAWQKLISGVTTQLKSRFFVDAKLLTRETSAFTDVVNSGGIPGVQIEFSLPKYARLHVISVGVYSESDYDSPDLTISFHDTNASGELLHEVSEAVSAGRNTINVDTDFEVDKLFIGYDADSFSLRKTENKYYPQDDISGYVWDKINCMFPCQFGHGAVRQIRGGGLNVKYVIYCSIERFVCENINLFKEAFYWRIGVELMNEVIFGNKVNCFTAITPERAKELMEFYGPNFDVELDNSVKGLNIYEDPFCFNCKNVVTRKTILP